MLKVKVNGQIYDFPSGTTPQEIEKRFNPQKQFDLKKIDLKDTDKSIVEGFLGGNMKSRINEFGFYEFLASTDEIDTDRDRFMLPLLQKWESDYKSGLPFLGYHDYYMPIGASYDARIEYNAAKSRNELYVKVYVLPDAELGTDKAINLIDANVFKKCSVRVRAGMPKYIEAAKSPDGIDYWEYSDPTNSVARELSLVPLGANQSAERTKKGNENVDKFAFEIIKNTSMYKIKSLNLSVDVDGGVLEAIKTLDNEVQDLRSKLESYQEAETKAKEAIQTKFVNLSKLVNESANESDLQILAKGLDVAELEKRILALEVQKTQNQNTPVAQRQEESKKSEKQNVVTFSILK